MGNGVTLVSRAIRTKDGYSVGKVLYISCGRPAGQLKSAEAAAL
jgi:hypothetical protein